MLHRRLVLASVLAALGAALIGVPASQGAKHASVTVVDYSYKPHSLTVPSGTKMTFKWAKGIMAPHNFHLIKAPAHVKHFKVGSAGKGKPVKRRKPFTFTLSKAGTYRFQCDQHTFMHLKIKVTK